MVFRISAIKQLTPWFDVKLTLLIKMWLLKGYKHFNQLLGLMGLVKLDNECFIYQNCNSAKIFKCILSNVKFYSFS